MNTSNRTRPESAEYGLRHSKGDLYLTATQYNSKGDLYRTATQYNSVRLVDHVGAIQLLIFLSRQRRLEVSIQDLGFPF